MNLFLKVLGSASIVGIITAISKIFFSPLAKLPYNKILKLANIKYNYNEENQFPLLNKIIIVTGSTSGLGKEIVINLYRVSYSFIYSSIFFFILLILLTNIIIVILLLITILIDGWYYNSCITYNEKND